ncbi:uncharacterized protein LOC125502052 [Athalia rosae]|uniref:uncharacterized protein LOC125502052 n=1 Tax=Athalia rosae TaxID=37344 RepID=UPI00203472FE|nr:uncharacterized protein LOC125502052 [Athalia rosae]
MRWLRISPTGFSTRDEDFVPTMASQCPEPIVEGVSLGSIVKYVLRHTRMTEASVRHAVTEVLNLGISMGRIGKTSEGTYFLMTSSPPAAAQNIREPCFSDDSSGSD